MVLRNTSRRIKWLKCFDRTVTAARDWMVSDDCLSSAVRLLWSRYSIALSSLADRSTTLSSATGVLSLTTLPSGWMTCVAQSGSSYRTRCLILPTVSWGVTPIEIMSAPGIFISSIGRSTSNFAASSLFLPSGSMSSSSPIGAVTGCSLFSSHNARSNRWMPSGSSHRLRFESCGLRRGPKGDRPAYRCTQMSAKTRGPKRNGQLGQRRRNEVSSFCIRTSEIDRP